MKKSLSILVAILGLLGALTATTCAATEEKEFLPTLEFKVPEDQAQREYLGLTGYTKETFSVSDIDADILLIELFSMYCPYCQREAPNVNALYEKMQQVSANGPKIKIIGIGASNSNFEVEHFRSTYNVAFPLFPDQDMAMYKMLKGAGTPGFIGSRLKQGEAPVIVLRNSGGFYNPEDFLQELMEKSGF